MPCTAQTTGFHTFCHFGLSSSPGSSWFQTSSGWPYGFFDVEPGAERAVAGGPQHDGVDRRVVLDPLPGVAHLLAHLAVEGVQHLGPVERDRRDVVVGDVS